MKSPALRYAQESCDALFNRINTVERSVARDDDSPDEAKLVGMLNQSVSIVMQLA